MANVQVIAKAKATGLIMSKMLGVEPDYEYAENYVRVYYQPDKLQTVQGNVNLMANKKDGEIKIDWLPIVQPLIIKKALPYLLGAGLLVYLISRKK